VAEAITHLESAQKKAVLVGGPSETSPARERWNSLVSATAD
jgi:hypothetical protein